MTNSPAASIKDPYISDCSQCFGLCCVALPYAKSADFPVNKAASEPCQNLDSKYQCRIHTDLREHGFKGCTVYECFGAGQKVSQMTYEGISWRDRPETAEEMFTVFPIMQQLHEMLYYVNEALNRNELGSLHPQLQQAYDEITACTMMSPAALVKVDVFSLRYALSPLLMEAGEQVSKRVISERKQYHSADFFGADCREEDFQGASLRGALFIAADLRGVNLQSAELLGADLRDANIRGADLRDTIFLTQAQVNAAIGDKQTKLPEHLRRPSHWQN